jgi:hypothetical protein
MRNWAWVAALLAAAGLLSSTSLASQDDEDQVSAVHFLILKDDNGKPVRNAAVVVHPVTRKGKQQRAGIELKTDAEGATKFDSIPYGKMRIQVLAPGFQTFGQDYDIDQPTTEITVKLKRPASQYSIYEEHPSDKSTDKKDESGSPKPSDAPPSSK